MPMIRSILLKGYYGFGNFGDDLLFAISWRWLRAHYPGASIRMCTESTDCGYLSVLVGENVEAVRNQEPLTVDLLFHGGGGTYFDFKKGPGVFGLVNMIARSLGPQLFRSLYQGIQAVRGRHRVRGRIRIGVGLGIGTYTNASRRFLFDFVELSEFDLLVVRDPASQRNATRLGVDANLLVATDLAFLTRFWIPAQSPNRIPRTLGIVLRDWPYDNDAHLHAVKEAVTYWQKAGYQLRFFSFDSTDWNYAKQFGALGDWIPWIPHTTSMEGFLKDFGSCEVVVSSRAHGVLTAACLGVPVVSLEIEPKLSAVADMVPQGIIRVLSPFQPQRLAQAVEEAARLEVRRGHPENEEKVLAALERVSELAPNS
jgi:polysaccharide pyruvyl transferase WcaK-like protein